MQQHHHGGEIQPQSYILDWPDNAQYTTDATAHNLEETNVTSERFISLVLLIAIAYSAATIQGQQIKRQGIQKYIARIKEYGRTERRQFLYRIIWSNLGQFQGDLYGFGYRINEIKSQ